MLTRLDKFVDIEGKRMPCGLINAVELSRYLTDVCSGFGACGYPLILNYSYYFLGVVNRLHFFGCDFYHRVISTHPLYLFAYL